MKKKKLLSLFLAAAMCMSVITGCGNQPSNAGTSEGTATTTETAGTSETVATEPSEVEGEKTWEFMSGDPVVLTVYPSSANAKSGLVTGTIADWLLEEYNIQLEIWPFSAEKTVSILTSGDLPDIMYFTNETDVESAILGDMVVNLEEHIADMPHIDGNDEIQAAINYVREFRSADTGEAYVMPTLIGDDSDAGIDTNRYGLKLYWDTYRALGCPEITDLDDTVQLFKDMQAQRSVAEDGTPVYALRLFYGYAKDYESTTMGFYGMYGYGADNLPYMIETDMVNGTYKSILDDDSLYKKGVKWYNTLMREGLIDPDSINVDRKTAYANTRAGYANAALCNATGFPAEGFYYAWVDDMDIYYKTSKTFGPKQYIGIGANTENLEAALFFLDFLANPADVLQFNDGPAGEKFEFVDGKAVLTAKYKDHLANNSGLFVYSKGDDETLINMGNSIVNLGEESSFGTMGKVNAWPEYTEIMGGSDTLTNWKADMGYDSWVELLKDNDALHKTSVFDDVPSFTPALPDDMSLTVSLLQQKVIDYTWKMYYAETDAEFDALWAEMVKTCEELGVADVIQWRLDELAKAQEIKDSLMKVK